MLLNLPSHCSVASKQFFVALQGVDHALFRLQLELGRELNVELHVEISSLRRALDGHALILQQLARAWSDLLIDGNRNVATIQGAEAYRCALEGIQERDLLHQHQIVTSSTVARVLCLLESHDEVRAYLVGRLVSHLGKDEL